MVFEPCARGLMRLRAELALELQREGGMPSISAAIVQPRLPTRRRVLVAEDHGALREMLVMLLRADGYDVVEVANGFDLVDAVVVSSDPELGSGKFDMVISDVRMPGMSGPNALASMDYLAGLPPVVFITAFADDQVHAQAQTLGAVAVFEKPLDFDELRTFVTNYFASPSSQGAIAT